MPVNEVRVIVNGTLKRTVAANTLTQSGADPRLYTTSFTLAHSELQTVSGKDAWIVVEAGVPLNSDATLPYVPTADPNVAWTRIMRGIYPVAVTNPIFVNVTGGAYKPPML